MLIKAYWRTCAAILLAACTSCSTFGQDAGQQPVPSAGRFRGDVWELNGPQLTAPELASQQPDGAAEEETTISDSLPFVSSLARSIEPLKWNIPVMGARSCAAAACHGGDRPGIAAPTAARGSEFQLWFENDPHARAAHTMTSPPALRMLQQLQVVVDGQIVDAEKYENCLACHNTTRSLTPEFANTRIEGVGCAACHGPERDWIETHHKPGCAQVSLADGYVRLDDLVVRARACAACHVGDHDRDMNHDIIAAGHPSLRYEFATYYQRLPKHWRDHEAADTGFESRLWLAGQIAGVDASLSLLAGRLDERTSVSTWPELSEYDCAACHHELRIVDPGSKLGLGERTGLARHSEWNRVTLKLLLRYRSETGEASEVDAQVLSALEALDRELDAKPQPDRPKVAQAVDEARLALDQWVSGSGFEERYRFDARRLSELVAFMAARTELVESWESVAQFYLAAVAGRAAWSDEDASDKLGAAQGLREALRFPTARAEASYPLEAEQSGRVERAALSRFIQTLGLPVTP